MMRIFNFVNDEPRTIFSPQYNYLIFECQLDIDLTDLKNTIIAKEQEIISNNEYHHDWGTGLGQNSLTSRSDSYNIMTWDQSKQLLKSIRSSHDTFIQHLEQPNNENLYIQGWANVLRAGEQIQPHQHWYTAFSYLGGHVCIQADNTNTYYINPLSKESWPNTNEPGKLTLFPNYIEHYTDRHQGTELRITVAFDIITETVYELDIRPERKGHWLKF